MDALIFIDQNGRQLNSTVIETAVLGGKSGIYDCIIEAEGSLEISKVYLKSNIAVLETGACTIRKRQMNVATAEDTYIGGMHVLYADLNEAVGNAVLVHNWGVSENAIAFKVIVDEDFTPSPPATAGFPAVEVSFDHTDFDNAIYIFATYNDGLADITYTWGDASFSLDDNLVVNRSTVSVGGRMQKLVRAVALQPAEGMFVVKAHNNTTGTDVYAYFWVQFNQQSPPL